MSLARTQNEQPPVFYQDISPGASQLGAIWITSTGTVSVYTISGWLGVSGEAAPSNVTNTSASPYTVLSSDTYIRAQRAGTQQILLPPATGSGRRITVKDIRDDDNGTVVVADGTDKIDEEASKSFSAFAAYTFIDGAAGKWDITG